VEGKGGRGAAAVLRSPSFRALLGARSAVYFGNSMGIVGLSFGVLQLPGGSAYELGAVLFARSAAQLALLLVGGVLGDRYSKKRVMMAADFLAGVSQLCVALEVIQRHNDPVSILALSAINGGATGLFLPVSTGVMPEVVERPLLQPGNAVLRASVNAANILGSALAGVLVATLGPGASLLVNALTYLSSVLLLSRLRTRGGGARQGASLLGELLDGWRTFVAQTWIWIVVAQAAVINMVYRGATQVLGPVEANRRPHGPELWALALGAQTLGFLAGSAAGLRIGVRFPLRVGALCLALLSLPILVLGSGIPLVWILPAMFVTGIALDLFRILWETTLQGSVPPEALTRVSSYDALGSFALAPLGVIAAGALAEGFDTRLALSLAGVAVVAVALAALLVPDVRDLAPVAEPAERERAGA
jgi:hypothetical protein